MTITGGRSKLNAPKRKALVSFFLRFLIGGLALWWISTQVQFDELRGVATYAWNHKLLWITALLAAFLGLCCGCTRWFFILRSLSFNVSYAAVFRFFFIGQFFNAFLPGGCGGDVVRAIYIARRSETRRTSAATSVFLDRAIGLLTTLMAAAIMTVLYTSDIMSDRGGRTIYFTVLGMAFCGICGVVLLLLVPKRFVQRCCPLRLEPVLDQIYQVLHVVHHDIRGCIIYALFSLANLLFLTVSCYFFGKSLGIDQPLLDYVRFFPVVTVLTAIPMTPGGVGVRETLFVQLFQQTGVSAARATSLSLFVYAGGLILSLLGGVIYLLDHNKTRPDQKIK